MENEVYTLPDFQIPEMSEALELVDLPLGISLLQWAGLVTRDQLFGNKLSEEFEKLKPLIATSLDGLNAGYLLKANVYTWPDGQVDIPGGQILTPIGLGMEPSDALAESFRPKSEWEVSFAVPPIGAKNSSYYIWVARGADGKPKVWHIPSVARTALEATARAEAKRRDRLGTFFETRPSDGFDAVQIASYWSDVQQRQLAAIRDAKKALDIAKKTAELHVIQTNANLIYLEYQRVLLKIKQSDDAAATMRQVAAVVAILKSGIELGQVCTETDANVGSQGSGGDLEKITLELGQTSVTLANDKIRLTKEWTVYLELLESKSKDIGTSYGDAGIPVANPKLHPL